MGLEEADGQVAAFGDLNGDSAVDLFVISEDATKVDVYLWNHEDFSFQVSPVSQITVPAGLKIVNVIPADFTYDGKLDVLVMMQGGNSQQTEMMLWLGKIGGGFGECLLMRGRRDIPADSVPLSYRTYPCFDRICHVCPAIHTGLYRRYAH